MSNSDLLSISISHHGVSHDFAFQSGATLSDLSDKVATDLSVPVSNQKFMISKLGLLKHPFKDIQLATIQSNKITLLGSTVAEVASINEGAYKSAASQTRPTPKLPVAKAYKTRDWKKESEEAQYTFTTLRPLPYLPNPQRSLEFLQRLKDDIGIKSAMRTHKFSVPLLTEMNPIEHTRSNAEGTTRTLGLNRNKGEVIELRLRTDAYDGYRDYKTIRNTLCHELAHCVWGPHDRNFWDLCKKIEREVDKVAGGGRTIAGDQDFYGGGEEADDHGGWEGGDFVLGGASAAGTVDAGLSRREILARAAEERMKRLKEQDRGHGNNP